MNKAIATAIAACALTALPAAASAEVLEYDFEMPITSLSDGYGVFDDLSVGDSLSVSVLLDTEADGDGVAIVNVAEVQFTSTGNWSSSWSDVQYDDSGLTWDAYTGTVTGSMVMNGLSIDHAVSYHQELYLDFTQSSTGELALVSGELELRLENGSSAKLTASYDPTQVPELDPKSGASGLAVLGGGLVIALSRRRRHGVVSGAA